MLSAVLVLIGTKVIGDHHPLYFLRTGSASKIVRMRFHLATLVLLVSLLGTGACGETELTDVGRPPVTGTADAGPSAVIAGAGVDRPPTPGTAGPSSALPTPASPERLTGVPPAVSARAVLVFDEASGTSLYESNSHDRLPPASLTKIATAVVVLEGAPSL